MGIEFHLPMIEIFKDLFKYILGETHDHAEFRNTIKLCQILFLMGQCFEETCTALAM